MKRCICAIGFLLLLGLLQPLPLFAAERDAQGEPPGKTKPYWTVHRILFAVGGGVLLLVAGGSAWRLRELRGLNRTLQAEIAERRQAELALRESEEQFRRLFHEHSAIFLLVEPESGLIIDANASAEQFYGYSIDELKQLTVSGLNIVSSEESAARRRAVVRHGKSHFEIIHKLKDGSLRTVEVYSACVSLQGRPLLFPIVHDITDRKLYEQELKQARQAAEAANQAKSDFLANMSHEIRTPMNGVIGMSQLLRYTQLTPEQEEYLASIELSADNLLCLINDILDFSKVEAGKITLESVPFDIHKAIREVTVTQISSIYQKRLQLHQQLSPEVPECVLGDQLRFKQILLNLLSNAIKFTQQGSITIITRLITRNEQQLRLLLTVSDTGIGLAPEEVERIFNPFEQADSSTTRRFGGTGLGLAICKQLTELMEGSLKVESKEGSGSSFHLELPFERYHQASCTSGPRVIALPGPVDGRAALQILVAEDNQISARMMSGLLKRLGHQCVTVPNGREAVERWQAEPFDCILMDIQMPLMNGIEATGIIRNRQQDEGSGHIPIIALTAHALRSDRERFLTQGFDGYLSKPVKIQELVEELARVV